MRHLLVVVAVIGCAGRKDDKPAPDPKPVTGVGSGSAAAPAALDPACVDTTTKLGAWLADLTAEGVSPVMTDGITLAKLDGEPPRPIALAPTVFISPKEVTFQGRLMSTVPITDKGQELQIALAADKATDTLFVVDAAVPWSTVAAAVIAAAAANHTHVTFVFAAGAAGKTAPPPPSAVDKELDELAKPADPSKPAPKLWDSKDPNRPPTIPDKVFKNCPVNELFIKIGSAETSADKDKLIVEGLPKAIATCGCKVEIASVQRLMWAWYRRDSSLPMLGVGVDVANKGTAVTPKPTAPWSEASKAVVAAAKMGKPITLQ